MSVIVLAECDKYPTRQRGEAPMVILIRETTNELERVTWSRTPIPESYLNYLRDLS